jgi:PRTRC genetic system protein E
VVQVLLCRARDSGVFEIHLKTVAKGAEQQRRRELEAGFHNLKEVRQQRIRYLKDIIAEYLVGYRLRYLRQRSVLLTVTHLEEDQIRVNIIPQKLKDGDNNALTTPLSVTGTSEELDRELPATIVDFVAAHLQLTNTLDKAKAEMDAAAKTAQAEAKAKTKTPAKREPVKPEINSATPAKPAQALLPEPAKTASLFDAPTPATSASADDMDEEDEILDEVEEDGRTEQDDGLDQAA